MVLAAGYGRRMRPLSERCHKALLPVAGTTILGRILDSLRAARVRTVTVVTGYRASDVREFAQRHAAGMAVDFVHNERYATTNNIVSLAMALDAMSGDEDVLLIECDLIFEPSLVATLTALPGNVALVDRYREGMDGTVVSVEDGLVTAIFPPSVQGEDFSYRDKYKTLNIYRFDRAFCRDTLEPALSRHARDVDATAYYEMVLGALVDLRGPRIAATVVEGAQWAEVDDPNDLVAARFAFEPDRRAEVLDRVHGGHWNLGLLDFAHIRNARFPTDAMLAAMAHALPTLVASYGSAQPVLNEKLGWFLECDPARVQALHGAAQAFPILARELAGRLTALPRPTFGEFPRLLLGERTYADAPGVDLDELAALAGQVEVLVVVTPNNPTGTAIATGWLHELAAAHPSTTFLVDESFQAFSGEEPLLRWLERAPLRNVLVLSSLSKSLGVPGLRLGYLYSCDPGLIARLGFELPIWNLGAPAEFLLELLLKYRRELDHSIERTLEDRAVLARALEELAIVERVHPSSANFLLVTLTTSAPPVPRIRAKLLAGTPPIDVRDAGGRFDDGSSRLRVAVRTRDENALLVAALEQVDVGVP